MMVNQGGVPPLHLMSAGSQVRNHRPVLVPVCPTGLLALDQPGDRGVQWRSYACTMSLSRNRATEKIYLRRQLVTHVVEHRRRMIGHRANLVHRPGILVQ